MHTGGGRVRPDPDKGGQASARQGGAHRPLPSISRRAARGLGGLQHLLGEEQKPHSVRAAAECQAGTATVPHAKPTLAKRFLVYSERISKSQRDFSCPATPCPPKREGQEEAALPSHQGEESEGRAGVETGLMTAWPSGAGHCLCAELRHP